MIITVDPTNSEDIAAFAMVKQYNLQNAIAEIATTEWSTISGSTRVTCTKALSPASGGGIMYAGDNICAIVSYALEGNNYDVASQAGVIVDSVSLANDTDIVYTVVFSADEMPTSTVKLNLIIYGDKMIGQETGEPVSAEEITAQVLSTINGRLTNLESGLLINDSVAKLGSVTAGTDTKPIKLVAGIPTAVTDTLAKDNAVVHLAGAETITGVKTFNYTPRGIIYSSTASGYKELFRIPDHTNLQTVTCYLVGRIIDKSQNRSVRFILALRTTPYRPVLKTDVPLANLFCTQNADNSVSIWLSSQRVIAYCDTLSRGNASTEYSISEYVQVGTLNTGATKPTVGDDYGFVEDSIISDDLVDMNTLDGYLPMVRITDNQTIGGTKTFSSTVYSDYAFLAKRPTLTRVDSTTARWKKAYRLTNYTSSGRSITFAVTSSRVGTLFVTLTVQAASAAVEVHATGRVSLASKVLVTKTSSETIVWIDTYGSTTRERIMVQCIDGFAIANFETITDDVAYTHDPNAKTMTDTNGNVITYTDLTAVETEMVDTVSAQTLAGAKTFTEAINAQSTLPALNLRNTYGVTNSTPSSNYWDAIYFKDKNGANEGLVSFAHYTSGIKDIFLQLNAENGTEKYFHLFANNDGTSYVTAPNRGYNPDNASIYANDVVTFTSLGAYTPMVKTSGNQEIGGTKTFVSTGFVDIPLRSARASGNIGGLTFKDNTDTGVSQIIGRVNGSVYINLLQENSYFEILNQRAYNTSNTNDVVTIGTLKNSTDVVRTTDNQTISGEKTFEAPLSATIHRSVTVKAATGTAYWIIAKIKNLSSNRYFSVTGIASRNSVVDLFGFGGQFTGGVYTVAVNSLPNIQLTTPQVYLGIGTYNGESYLILKTVRQVTPTIAFLSSVYSSGDYFGNLEIVTPTAITQPADYAEGGVIL